MPGTEQVIKSAADNGWEAVMLATLVITGFVAFGLFLKWSGNQMMAREVRMASRVDTLEEFIRVKLLEALDHAVIALDKSSAATLASGDLVKQSTIAIDRLVTNIEALSTTIRSKPCLMELDKQLHVLSEFRKTIQSQPG